MAAALRGRLPGGRARTGRGGCRFDLADVQQFLRARGDDARQAQERDRERLAALPAPVVAAPAEAPGAAATRQALEAWRLRRAQREEAERAGALLPVAAVAPALSEAFARLSRNMRAFVRQLGRERDWPDPYLRQVETRLAEQQRASVAAALAELGG